MQLVTFGGMEGTDKPLRGVPESYRGGQPELICSGLARLRPTVTNVENKNISQKLLFTVRLDSGTFYSGTVL